jgi:phosphoribosyl 1,2-cyclic phosphate phosphodiesterase
MKITVLGSGTSHGVPMIGCRCPVCTSTDPRNSRNRPCLLITSDSGAQILVDTPPEFRLMAVRCGLHHLDGVLYTHSHADHLFGLDDLRAFNFLQDGPIPLYAEEDVLADIRRVFEYCFVPTQLAGGKPNLELVPIEPGKSIDLEGLRLLPLRVFHGNLPILAFKIGSRAAYVTDVSKIPESSWPELVGLDILLLDAVRRRPHPTHFHLEKALEIIAELRPKNAFLVHLSHDYDFETTNASLPAGVALAYDGQEIDVDI